MEDELARFRFIVPALGQQGAGFDDVQPDFPWLCETMILPALSEAKVTADRVVISMADQAVTFGEAAPDAIQFFEVFRVENGACVWEAF